MNTSDIAVLDRPRCRVSSRRGLGRPVRRHWALPLPQPLFSLPTELPPLRINALSVTGEPFVSDDEGMKLYPILKWALSQGRKVTLSIAGLHIIGGFFDESIGKLYGDFPEERVDAGVKVVDGHDGDACLLKDAIRWAKKYYYHRDAYDRIQARYAELNKEMYGADFYDDDPDI